jgi:hypothetical protein
MARNRPVAIWRIRQSPSIDPKFHQIDRLDGVGRSIRTPFTIFSAGCDFRIGLNIGEWA